MSSHVYREIDLRLNWHANEVRVLPAQAGGKHGRLKPTPYQRFANAKRRNFVVWIHTAKRTDARERRIHESIALLAAGKKLGLK